MSRYFQINQEDGTILALPTQFVEEQEKKGTLWCYISDVVSIIDAKKSMIGSVDYDRFSPLPETFCWLPLQKKDAEACHYAKPIDLT